MKKRLLSLAALSASALLLLSCTSTAPTAGEMDHYYKHAETQANQQILILSGQRQRGEISETYYNEQVSGIRADIPKQAGELAWARHELSESRKRAAGIPTSDLPTSTPSPQTGASGSFYQRAGDPGSGFGNSTNTYQGGSGFNYGNTPSTLTSTRGY